MMSQANAAPLPQHSPDFVPPEYSEVSDSVPEYSLVIESQTRHSFAQNLQSQARELWHGRELLMFLVWRDLKVRYVQTAMGASWVILQPLMTMALFSVFGRWARVPNDGVPYPLFHYSGALLWILFSNALGSCSNSFTGNAQLITKVYFPRLVLPLSSVLGRVVDFGVACVLLAVMMLIYRVPLTWNFLMMPVILLLTILLALGGGLYLASVNVRYRDVSLLMPTFLQILMFASPLIYSSNMIPEHLRAYYMLNPLVGLFQNYRACLFGQPFNWVSLSVSAFIIFSLFLYALMVFGKQEEYFADVI